MKFPISHIVVLLTSHGWEKTENSKFSNHLLLFTNPSFPLRELSLPILENAPDYEDAVSLLLYKLANIEKQPLEKLTKELETVREGHLPLSSDSLVLRVVKATDNGDGIPLMLARTALSETEILIMAASCQAEKPATYYRRIDNRISNSLLERAVFNHTRYGSFILSVSCPILMSGEQFKLGLDNTDLPTTRKAFQALYSGIGELETAIADRKHIQFADDILISVHPLISANMAQAVANIAASDTGGGLEFGFSWSELIRPTVGNDPCRVVSFSSSDSAQLYEVAEKLRPKEASLTNRFIGTVEALSGDVTNSGKRAGKIELLLNIPDIGWTRATAELSEEQYKIADAAHINGAQFVAITGTLEPKPRVWFFSSIEIFEKISSP